MLAFLAWLRPGRVGESVLRSFGLSAVSVKTGADIVGMLPYALQRVSGADGMFTLNKFECSKQAHVPEKSCME